MCFPFDRMEKVDRCLMMWRSWIAQDKRPEISIHASEKTRNVRVSRFCRRIWIHPNFVGNIHFSPILIWNEVTLFFSSWKFSSSKQKKSETELAQNEYFRQTSTIPLQIAFGMASIACLMLELAWIEIRSTSEIYRFKDRLNAGNPYKPSWKVWVDTEREQ